MCAHCLWPCLTDFRSVTELEENGTQCTEPPRACRDARQQGLHCGREILGKDKGELKGPACVNQDLKDRTEKDMLYVILWLHYWSGFACPEEIASTPWFQPSFQEWNQCQNLVDLACHMATLLHFSRAVSTPVTSPSSSFHVTVFLSSVLPSVASFFLPKLTALLCFLSCSFLPLLLPSNGKYLTIIFLDSLPTDFSLFVSL